MGKLETLNTGTTTLGIVCKDAILFAADRRATAGNFIANKNISKIMQINEHMALTVAGTVSDVQLMVKYLKAELKLKSVRTGRNNTVKEAANLLAGMVYNNIRKFSAIPGISHFLFGGYDNTGCQLYEIYPDGSITKIEDFVSSGSGSVMVYGVLETSYKPDMNGKEAEELALRSMKGALLRDSASGNGVDIITISKAGVKQTYEKTIPGF
ncbi:proteasome subunit beta [Candidatus Woesearchaeota archaeon]|nr:MAG: proteasome subunit beta [Candidatus Woesearchaeota archaeon]